MKITDDEREAAYELRCHIDGILFERERAALYREIYARVFSSNDVHHTLRHEAANLEASAAIANMEKAFEPVCPTCGEESERAAQQKAN